MRVDVRWFNYLTVGLVLSAVTAPAADRSVVGTLAREATPARPVRPAEIAKDASPPKSGGTRRPGDFRKDAKDSRSRNPVIVFGQGGR